MRQRPLQRAHAIHGGWEGYRRVAVLHPGAFTEVLTMPCDCQCCYEVEATVVDLAPGEYTVEFCWYDYETAGERCYVEDIVIS
jgi:hypothetical protein